MYSREFLEQMNKDDIITLFLANIKDSSNIRDSNDEIYICGYVKRICDGCPSVFMFHDINGYSYRFCLRYGSWRLENTTWDKLVCLGNADNRMDGICSWSDAKRFMAKAGYYIIE